jgi:hypothetical protein
MSSWPVMDQIRAYESSAPGDHDAHPKTRRA